MRCISNVCSGAAKGGGGRSPPPQAGGRGATTTAAATTPPRTRHRAYKHSMARCLKFAVKVLESLLFTSGVNQHQKSTPSAMHSIQ